uniref:Disease resistance protein RPM1 n=1 Tax=Aegilops tauschii TaxID=37682 RepID=R7W726_AEGTA
MAEIVILLAIKKIGIALAKGAADQARVQFAKYGAQLLELQGSMGRVPRELRVMHDVLCQMDIRNRSNQVYEGWLEEVRKVAHVMEDMVDEYLYLVGREHDIGCCFFLKKGVKKPRSLLCLNQIALSVKELEKDLSHLSKTKNRWVPMINNGDSSNLSYIVKRSQELANISRLIDEEDLVGVDKNREKLEQWWGGDDQKCSVIALLGMGGLGKTALAANVYKREREKFQCYAWVSISQTYSREDVLRNMIKELFKDNASALCSTLSMDIMSLEETLKKYLEQRKYLIILDDVWDPEAFHDLSRMLTHNDKGSRVILTTREASIAALASQGHSLTLKALPEDKAWDLFCKKAFPRDTNHECPTDLKPSSKEIVSKCKGLPLAVVSVGSLLSAREKAVEEWRRINDQLSWEIINNSSLDHIRNVLHLSFIYLPTYLKSCFLYCSLFPEDYLFKRKQLVRLFIAEGFIKERGESTLEEVAEGYLKELVDRNMLQLVEGNSFKALPEDKAWDLFCKKAFPRDTNHECPTDLKPSSKEIVSKCKGLPLAVVSVGSLLSAREKTVEEWRRINDQLSWEIINNSSLDHIRNVLHLSFIYLPTYLKSCFLYCSLFPEDYLFKRKQLVRLFIAEGFIKERGESTLEEVAEGYLKELVDRNMLQLVERNSFGRVKKFRMHDLVRELAVDLCKKNCFGASYEDQCGGSLEMDGRRLVLHKVKKDIQQPFSNMHQLRTVITLGDSKSSCTLLPLLCTESRYLTVLELSGLPLEKIPDAIGDLFNLRHLGLRGSKVKMLPKTIENLSNLLTLDLYESDIHKLPSGIVKLKKLRHLFAERVIDAEGDFECRSGVCIPIGLGNLTNLQTLQALEVQDECLRHLGELRQMRSLRLWNVKGMYCGRISESLVRMPYLSNLDVNASDEDEVLLLNVCLPSLQKLSLRGRLAEGALDESPLFQADGGQNLYVFYLSWSQLREDPLPSLSRLANMTCLHFTRAYNGEQLSFLVGWFPKLKVLSLRDLPNLSRLEVQQGAMASLEELFLANLSSMTEVPAGIEFLLPLQHLSFLEITNDFLTMLYQCSVLEEQMWHYSLRD